MFKSKRALMAIIVSALCLVFMANVVIAGATLGGVIYEHEIDGETKYIEVTPTQFFQLMGAADPARKAIVEGKTLKAISDTLGNVITPSTFFQIGADYSKIEPRHIAQEYVYRYRLVGDDWVPVVVEEGPQASNIKFQGENQVIGADNTITIAVNPGATYNDASVTISQNALVTIASASRTRTALVEKGTIDGAAALDIFKPAKGSATGQELIDEGVITVTLGSVDANNELIPGQITVYTVNFVAK